ncbi:hypothetical protein F2Q69_00021759 [Brassica cretica]|uniref:Uncharacterized protein n=1 Tax=Brassica cretica TaxID=69181 RepID=A0A8S9QPY3_BRACR|nr:hypothetical protein F2Q69_00021759 [Brassica cretica]
MHGLMSYRRFGRARSLRSDRAWLELGRYRPSGTNARSLRSDRAFARARSLHSDRAERLLSRYVATELWLELGRYVATERDGRLVATPIRNWSGYVSDGLCLNSNEALSREHTLRRSLDRA